MDSIYAETINSFASDLDHIWKDKKKFQHQNTYQERTEGNCSLNRFLLSASSKFIGQKSHNPEIINTTQRLIKTSSLWIQPDFKRSDADKILQEFEPGIFIIRVNSDSKTMVLSYKTEDRVQHVKIKVDLRRGFFMDGSSNIFKSVNEMIAHYMTHMIQFPELLLKLPRALREANDAAHFKFFDNLKSDFWKTSLPNKSIDEIFIKASDAKTNQPCVYNEVIDSELTPPLPPREYDINDLTYIQGLAEIEETEEGIVYNEIVKEEKSKSKAKPFQDIPTSITQPTSHYSPIWQCTSSTNPSPIPESKSEKEPVLKSCDPNASLNNVAIRDSIISQSFIGDSIRTEMTLISTREFPDKDFYEQLPGSLPKNNLCLIKDVIKNYFPQLVDAKYICERGNMAFPSLSQDILMNQSVDMTVERQQFENENSSDYCDKEVEYDTPWELKNPWISKYIDIEKYDGVKQSEYMEKIIKLDSQTKKFNESEYSSLPAFKSSNESVNIRNLSAKNRNSLMPTRKSSLISYTDDEDEQESEEQLQQELLAEIQPVVYSSPITSPIYSQSKALYGQSIRKYLIQLCSRKGHSDISNSVRTFIQCTMERTDLSPYTTMRLMRQYMSGLKNMIKQQKSELSLVSIIEEERKKTPKNVFINFESIIESVLTKAVVKPLSDYVYRLLVLEHYKNNNLKLISDGVEQAKNLEPTKLGLEKSSISIIDSKVQLIQKKFHKMAKQYSPEKKIAHIISIIEIVFKLVKSIYPKTRSDSMRNDFKSDYLLPILVYIFSQCKIDAISTQCEVEYIEGLIWSSTLVDGEPGFYLMNIMSSLEAIKVLGRPSINPTDAVDLRNNEPIKINNSAFFSKINPSTISAAAVGSVNVIILDEKLNRLVTKTFPVRSTVTVGNLCNAIAHRLGIFNPKEYSLYKYTGADDVLLNEFEYPLAIKQTYQQKTGETVNFLFKRRNAIFILPSLIQVK